MNTVKQISVVIDNSPGTLKRICGALREEDINVHGFCAWGETDHGIVRIICDRPLKALDLLEQAGMIALSRDVLEIRKENRPGALHEIAAVLETVGINIDYAYGSTPDSGEGCMYLGVSDPVAARKAFKA